MTFVRTAATHPTECDWIDSAGTDPDTLRAVIRGHQRFGKLSTNETALDVHPEFGELYHRRVARHAARFFDVATYRSKLHLPNATDANTPTEKRLRGRLRYLFEAALDERFEDGMESEFSKQLVWMVHTYGNAAVAALDEYLDSEHPNAEVVAEALRWLGNTDDVDSHKYRLYLLMKHLRSSSPRVRDAAGLGLASMNDASAVSALIEAIQRELVAELRRDLKLVLEQLDPPSQCHSS